MSDKQTAKEANTAKGIVEEEPGDTRFRKVGGGQFFKFEEAGDRVTGHYMGYTFQDLKSGKETVSVAKYIVMPEGETDPVEFLGSYALVEFFSRVPMGALVQVTYTGEKEKTGSGFSIKKFDVELAYGYEMLEPVKTSITALPESYAPPVPPEHPGLDKGTGEIFDEKEAIDV